MGDDRSMRYMHTFTKAFRFWLERRQLNLACSLQIHEVYNSPYCWRGFAYLASRETGDIRGSTCG